MSREEPSHSFAESKHLPFETLDYPSIAEQVVNYIKCKLAKIDNGLSRFPQVTHGPLSVQTNDVTSCISFHFCYCT